MSALKGRRSRPRLHLLGIVVALLALPLIQLLDADRASAGQRLVLAKYYAWYDENTWSRGQVADMPVQTYRSADRGAIQRHVDQARSAGIDAFALSWLGPNNPTDANLQALLGVAQEKGFRATIDFETSSPLFGGADDVAGGLRYATDRYTGHPSWLRYDGKPVIVFWFVRRFDVPTWRMIRDRVDPHRQAVWIAEGDRFEYLDIFDGIHPYSIAWSSNPAATLASYAQRTRDRANRLGIPRLWMATVMPGYDDRTTGRPDAFVRDRAGGQYYRSTWDAAMATNPELVVITSFNEWVEGSMIEPSVSYGNLYLDLTREYANRYRQGAALSLAPAPALAPAPSSADWALPGGRFFTQASGQPASSRLGFSITNDGGIGFWDSFNRLGGLTALGFPSSQRFSLGDGFVYQATQGALLQWRPELARAVLANTFEMMEAAGKDDWLLTAKGIPRPIRHDGSGGNWQQAKEIRLSWLTNPDIRAHYFKNPNPAAMPYWRPETAIDLYGLPMSQPERHGPFIVQRFQRIAFQLWVEAVPGMPAPGTVVRVLGGDLAKEAGLLPAGGVQPQR